jgi:hypothetical protein
MNVAVELGQSGFGYRAEPNYGCTGSEEDG